MTRATWLADVLRDAGLTVVETEGWKDRGRDMAAIRGVICHHTGPGSREGLLNLIKNGRNDLPGPLSQLFLDDDGTYYVIAAGRTNHAGKGKWQGITNGNSNLIGIEARNAGDGKDDWPDLQMFAYEHGVAAILKHIGADEIMAMGHKEWAQPKGRKVDPTFDMLEFREGVALAMLDPSATLLPSAPPKPRTVDPVRAMLKKGDTGASVKQLQKLLKIEADGIFGPMTENAVKTFQRKRGLVVDGKVGPKTWAALDVK
jgi:N-acetyl-anhydromuramyl-L-alanine amidase AmpD